MPAPTDMPLALTRTAIENALRGLALMEEAQQQFMRLQLKAAEDALTASRTAMNELDSADDWPSLGAMPSAMLRRNIERNAGLVQNSVKLMADMQSAWLATMRDASESMQRCQADAIASGGTATAGFPIQAMFERLNGMMHAPMNAATEAATQAVHGTQAAARHAKRGEHAN